MMVRAFGIQAFAVFILLSAASFIPLQALVISSCGKSKLTDKTGTILSPHYPTPFDSQVQCEWVIESPKKTLLRIDILDLDLDQDCSQHWLSVPSEGGRGYNILCGQQFPSHPITVVQQFTSIKYFSSETKKESRGFAMRYVMEDIDCGPNDQHCQNGDCMGNGSRCDGVKDCKDGSDEFGCPSMAACNAGYLPCPSAPTICYSVAEQACNGEFFCPHGEDEVGCSAECPKQIACGSSDGCYDPAQRCNEVRNCRDNSDETFCGDYGGCTLLEFICRNGGCAPATTICDGKDDCGDSSDEENCRSSLLTTATLGLIACGCMSCVGLVLLYRLYRTKLMTNHFSDHYGPDDEEEEEEDQFTYREPPPPYSAVAEVEVNTLPASESFHIHSRRSRRRVRRCGRNENRAASQARAYRKLLILPIPKPVPRARSPAAPSTPLSPVTPVCDAVPSSSSVGDLISMN